MRKKLLFIFIAFIIILLFSSISVKAGYEFFDTKDNNNIELAKRYDGPGTENFNGCYLALSLEEGEWVKVKLADKIDIGKLEQDSFDVKKKYDLYFRKDGNNSYMYIYCDGDTERFIEQEFSYLGVKVTVAVRPKRKICIGKMNVQLKEESTPFRIVTNDDGESLGYYLPGDCLFFDFNITCDCGKCRFDNVVATLNGESISQINIEEEIPQTTIGKKGTLAFIVPDNGSDSVAKEEEWKVLEFEIGCRVTTFKENTSRAKNKLRDLIGGYEGMYYNASYNMNINKSNDAPCFDVPSADKKSHILEKNIEVLEGGEEFIDVYGFYNRNINLTANSYDGDGYDFTTEIEKENGISRISILGKKLGEYDPIKYKSFVRYNDVRYYFSPLIINVKVVKVKTSTPEEENEDTTGDESNVSSEEYIDSIIGEVDIHREPGYNGALHEYNENLSTLLDRINNNDFEIDAEMGKETRKLIVTILNYILFFGVILSTILIAILGWRYIIGSPSQKADFRENLVTFVIGSGILLMGTALVKFIISVASNW